MHCETLDRPKRADDLNAAAREQLLAIRGEPLFFADWLRAVFIHFEVPVEELQASVPFELDLLDGKAYVSLVAFRMQGMRPRIGGRLAAWLLKPIASNDYLNVRTYVRHRNESGIYFLTEWMNNRFSIGLGPLTFGLPYRFGHLNYVHRHEDDFFKGVVCEKEDGPRLAYRAESKNDSFTPCPAESLDEFLLERYTAFTSHGARRQLFRIWHPTWLQKSIKITISDCGLLEHTWPWFGHARLVGGNYSPGAHNVWMGRPQRIDTTRP